MRYLTIIAGLCFIPMLIKVGISYGAEDQRDQQSSQQSAQSQSPPSRPILPPVAPSGVSVVSPTPSPHIATPPISTGVISVQSHDLFHPSVSIKGSSQSVPAYPSSLPAGIPLQADAAYLPGTIMGSCVGEVLDTGVEQDGTQWIELNDELFGSGKLKAKIRDPKNTTIVTEDNIASFGDIKIGDTVNILFNKDGDDIVTNFIGIVSEEDAQALQSMSEEKKGKQADE